MLYQDTSRDAWRQFAGDSASVDDKIMAVIRAAGEAGCSCLHVERCTGIAHQTASGNLRHLVEAGRVVDTGREGRTEKGRRVKLWRLAPQGTLAPPQRRTRADELAAELERVALQLERWAVGSGEAAISVRSLRTQAHMIRQAIARRNP